MDYDEFTEDRVPIPKKRRKFNKRLNTQYLSVEESDDTFRAQLIRIVARQVSRFISPTQLISTLFIMALYTIIVLAFTMFSDIAFIFFEVFGDLSGEASMKLGTVHDAKLRAFGIVFAALAIMVELDLPFVTKRVAMFKSFIPRSILLVFVATLSEINPMLVYEKKHGQGSFYNNDDAMNDDFNPSAFYGSYGYSSNGYNSKYGNRILYGNVYNSNGYNSNSGGYSSNYSSNYTASSQANKSSSSGIISDEMPAFVLRLQSLSTSLLLISVLLYLIAGLLCFDQFEPLAFVPDDENKQSPDHLPKVISGRKLQKQSSSPQIDTRRPGQDGKETLCDYDQYENYVEGAYGPGFA